MKVHLVKTPEYSLNSFIEVSEFVKSFEGSIQFYTPSFDFDALMFPYIELEETNNLMCEMSEPVFKHNPYNYKKDKYQHKILQWEQLLELCKYFRLEKQIPSEDFVILLTERSNEWNWFSFSDEERNAFVQVEGWGNYIHAHHKYPVAYQIMENILQSLMKIDVIHIPNRFVHKSPRGCINDFCQKKKDVILKLRTADICADCFEKIEEERIDQNLVNQVLLVLEGIRNELLFKQKYKKQISPVPILLNEKKQILLPQLENLEIRLNPLFKTLYIFYLKHTEGIRLKELIDYKAELLSIYKKLSVMDNNEGIELKITDLVDPFGGSFSQKKSKLNKIITDLLGEPLAKFYRIDGEPGEAFKINLPQNLIDIRY